MKLAKILTLLRSEPLLCDNGYRASLLELFEQHSQLSKDDFKSQRTGRARSGSDLDVDQSETRDGIAIIPIGGPLGIDLGEFEKGAGAVDMDDISKEIDEAEENDEVNAIILDFDSPGGTVNGTFELADKILGVEKPIYAFTRGTVASAAYALAAATDGIFATKSAIIGNIGVYTTFMDMSSMAEKMGVRVKVFSSGPIKALGVPGTSLTAEQEIFTQNRIMMAAQTFFDHIRETRGGISDEDMGGQFYSGEEAVRRGFADEIMTGIAQLESFLRE